MTFDVESLKKKFYEPSFEPAYEPVLVLRDEDDEDLDDEYYIVNYSLRQTNPYSRDRNKIVLDCCWLRQEYFENILKTYSEKLESGGAKFIFKTSGEYDNINIYVEVKPVAIIEDTVYFKPVDSEEESW